jgi:hypothetical protein
MYIYWARTRAADKTVEASKSKAQLSVTAAAGMASPTAVSSAGATPMPSAGETHETKNNGESAAPSKAASGDARNKTSKQVFFRYNGIDSHYGQLAFAPYERPDQPQFAEALSCEVAYVAGGRGICLAANRGVFTTYAAKLFDATSFQILAEFPLKGAPSRCRMSVDGKLAAFTVFISGHGYASVNFSTQTLLIDVDRGRIIADLEQFSVTRDEQPLSAKDFNFWGVAFTPDARHFYATLSTNQQHFLVKGDIAKRSVAVIHDNVECPSLSPDASRIAYKKRFVESGRIFWRLHILDLKTGGETPLAEKRSVDDQLEWLDNDHVLYALPESETGSSASTNIWLAAADGASAPKLFLRKAYSPSVTPSL